MAPGVVYKAEDTKLGRPVALKFLPTDKVTDPDSRARLVREARLASKLNHPNICTIHEVGEDEGQVFVAMELVEGQSLSAGLSEGALPIEDVLRLQSDVAREIARQINITLTPEKANRLAGAHEVNPKVYEAYTRGKFYVSQNTTESFEKGMQYMHQAVEIDPAEPLGYVGLAEGYITLGHGGAELAESIRLAGAAAEQALKLDPDRAEAVGVLAEVALYYEWDWDKAERLFKRALELDPNVAKTHYHYAWYLALFNVPLGDG